jgi:hypothetical protein
VFELDAFQKGKMIKHTVAVRKDGNDNGDDWAGNSGEGPAG